jgi:hypothetical protein
MRLPTISDRMAHVDDPTLTTLTVAKFRQPHPQYPEFSFDFAVHVIILTDGRGERHVFLSNTRPITSDYFTPSCA